MMTATTKQVPDTSRDVAAAGENGVRAALYGAIAHLFADRPDAALLQCIADSDAMIIAQDSTLSTAWHALCTSAATIDPAVVRNEFDALFVSPGQPAVSLYASSYMPGRERGQLLAELRGDLARLGYARAEGSNEYEDHLAALCDVMRGLIGEEGLSSEAATQQQEFFQHYFAPWYSKLFEKIAASESSGFYRQVAHFADAFLTHESQYFELA